MRTYYIIKENPSEFTSPVPVYIGETLEEAEAHIMGYSDWYCSCGTCRIDVCDEYLTVSERRYYRDGQLDKVDTKWPQRQN